MFIKWLIHKKIHILIAFVSVCTIASLVVSLQNTLAYQAIPAQGNLTSGSIITVSSIKSLRYTPDKAVDGNDTTRWESRNADKQWIRVDLGQAKPVGKIALLWEPNTTKTYSIQVSSDNKTWQNIGSTVSVTPETIFQTHDINVSKRYIRINTTSRYSTRTGNGLREIGVYPQVVQPTLEPTSAPTPSPIFMPTPQVSPIPLPDFVYVCGMQTCLNNKPFVIHSATAYGKYASPQEEIELALNANLNTLEIVEYESQWRTLASTMSEETWKQNDQFIATAKENGIKIILNFSSYGHTLARAGYKPTNVDWNPFLEFVMNRVNTVTGIKYADDPTIAKIQLYGEIAAPNYNDPMRGTSEETTAFYKRTLAQLQALDTKHIISTGGFSYINDPNSGIDWKTIMADPNNDICDVEINSYGDRNVNTPNVANYCKAINKPWFLAAWSSCQGTPHFKDDINHWQTDETMASHAADMNKIARNENPDTPGPAIAAIGSSFWNLASTSARLDNCDIGPQYPQTLEVVQQYAPQR